MRRLFISLIVLSLLLTKEWICIHLLRLTIHANIIVSTEAQILSLD
jgi:hypothetical protein